MTVVNCGSDWKQRRHSPAARPPKPPAGFEGRPRGVAYRQSMREQRIVFETPAVGPSGANVGRHGLTKDCLGSTSKTRYRASKIPKTLHARDVCRAERVPGEAKAVARSSGVGWGKKGIAKRPMQDRRCVHAAAPRQWEWRGRGGYHSKRCHISRSEWWTSP